MKEGFYLRVVAEDMEENYLEEWTRFPKLKHAKEAASKFHGLIGKNIWGSVHEDQDTKSFLMDTDWLPEPEHSYIGDYPTIVSVEVLEIKPIINVE